MKRGIAAEVCWDGSCQEEHQEGTSLVGKNRRRTASKGRPKPQRGTPRSRGERSGPGAPGPFGYDAASGPVPDRQLVRTLWVSAFVASGADLRRVPATLRELGSLPARLVEEQAQILLLELVAELWSSGWQPAELRRQLRITTSALVAGLCEIVIHADHDARPGQGIDPRWAQQVASLGGRDVSTSGPWLSEWRERAGLSRAEAYQEILALGRAGAGLGRLDILIPPPGASPATVVVGAPARAGDQHPMLDRIRKLLAKAEATEFEEEAASFTAKAQELMTRHAIDQALLNRQDAGDVPRMARVPIDAPYADAKSLLLGVVATANRCRAVHLTNYHMSSLLGHADDLTVVEMLFTSLLIQAQTALADAGRGSAGTRARSVSFRSSFLIAYAHRIGERLEAVNTTSLADVAVVSAVPVLRAREDAVEEFLSERYGDSLSAATLRGGYDPLGRAHGRRAADEARLDAGQITR